jgi:hypothetical protein
MLHESTGTRAQPSTLNPMQTALVVAPVQTTSTPEPRLPGSGLRGDGPITPLNLAGKPLTVNRRTEAKLDEEQSAPDNLAVALHLPAAAAARSRPYSAQPRIEKERNIGWQRTG